MSGNGQGLGKGIAKRHRKVLHDNTEGITKPIYRLIRRGGAKRIYGLIYKETRLVLKKNIFKKCYWRRGYLFQRRKT